MRKIIFIFVFLVLLTAASCRQYIFPMCPPPMWKIPGGKIRAGGEVRYQLICQYGYTQPMLANRSEFFVCSNKHNDAVPKQCVRKMFASITLEYGMSISRQRATRAQAATKTEPADICSDSPTLNNLIKHLERSTFVSSEQKLSPYMHRCINTDNGTTSMTIRIAGLPKQNGTSSAIIDNLYNLIIAESFTYAKAYLTDQGYMFKRYSKGPPSSPMKATVPVLPVMYKPQTRLFQRKRQTKLGSRVGSTRKQRDEDETRNERPVNSHVAGVFNQLNLQSSLMMLKEAPVKNPMLTDGASLPFKERPLFSVQSDESDLHWDCDNVSDARIIEEFYSSEADCMRLGGDFVIADDHRQLGLLPNPVMNDNLNYSSRWHKDVRRASTEQRHTLRRKNEWQTTNLNQNMATLFALAADGKIKAESLLGLIAKNIEDKETGKKVSLKEKQEKHLKAYWGLYRTSDGPVDYECPPHLMLRKSGVEHLCVGCGKGWILHKLKGDKERSCFPCGPGYFNDVETATTCKPCPIKYKNAPWDAASIDECFKVEISHEDKLKWTLFNYLFPISTVVFVSLGVVWASKISLGVQGHDSKSAPQPTPVPQSQPMPPTTRRASFKTQDLVEYKE